MNADFDINKYLGTWYELAHYPSFFQRNDNYNTKAEYMLMPDNTVKVHNSTISQGKQFDSFGIARQLNGRNLRVDFPQPEITKLINSKEFTPPKNFMIDDKSQPNYVIDNIWVNNKDCYMYAVVTDPKKESLYFLSRNPNPPLCEYNLIMEYVVANYDRDRLVQTPHFI
jgi:apolipoprotein D and lipocalin family protein